MLSFAIHVLSDDWVFSLSPASGERVGVRGFFAGASELVFFFTRLNRLIIQNLPQFGAPLIPELRIR